MLLTTHPLLVLRSWKSIAIPLPTLSATTGPLTGTLYFFNILNARVSAEDKVGDTKIKLFKEWRVYFVSL